MPIPIPDQFSEKITQWGQKLQTQRFPLECFISLCCKEATAM
jgi:hypothetical protein